MRFAPAVLALCAVMAVAGCAPKPMPTVKQVDAQCELEADRLYIHSDNAADIPDYVQTCMVARGYNRTFRTTVCKNTSNKYDIYNGNTDPDCYELVTPPK